MTRIKFQNTWKNKPQEEKDEIKLRIANTRANWSDEEKAEVKRHLIEANARLTPEEKRLKNEKMIASRIIRCGSASTTRTYYYYGELFDSSWELAVWIYCIDHGIPITRNTNISFQYYVPNEPNPKYYTPDFIINGKLIEIKGPQFWKEDGTMKASHYKKRMKLEDGSHAWVDMTNSERILADAAYEAKHQCAIDHGVEFWLKEDCLPYIMYCLMKFNSSIQQWYKVFEYRNYFTNPSYWYPTYCAPKPKSIYAKHKGISTYDMKPDSDGYVFPNKGVSPYDIPQLTKPQVYDNTKEPL